MSAVIALDAMGGDHAPREIVMGALQAVQELQLSVILVGIEDQIRPLLPANCPPVKAATYGCMA